MRGKLLVATLILILLFARTSLEQPVSITREPYRIIFETKFFRLHYYGEEFGFSYFKTDSESRPILDYFGIMKDSFFINTTGYTVKSDRAEIVIAYSHFNLDLTIEEHVVLLPSERYFAIIYVIKNNGTYNRQLNITFKIDYYADEYTEFKAPGYRDYWFSVSNDEISLDAYSTDYILMRGKGSGWRAAPSALVWSEKPQQLSVGYYDEVYVTYSLDLPPGGSRIIKFFITASPWESETEFLANSGLPAVDPLPAEEVIKYLKYPRLRKEYVELLGNYNTILKKLIEARQTIDSLTYQLESTTRSLNDVIAQRDLLIVVSMLLSVLAVSLLVLHVSGRGALRVGPATREAAPRVVESGALKEAVRLRAYLAALEELYRKGEITETAYRKLKEEYESKLKQIES